ncbi:PEP-CTERM sorting domain-containing protein [Thalassotalea fusca]
MSVKFLGAILLLVNSYASQASLIVLDFEGVGDTSSISSFYNGGTDSEGNSGTNYGVEFSPNALGVVDSDDGGAGNFANEPSGSTVMYFVQGTAILNYAAGFDTGFSFYYSSSQSASVSIYDGLNASGNLLGHISLSANHNDNNCVGDPDGTYCNWDNIGASFAGMAKSIDFGGTVNKVAFDNITFGSSTAVNDIPEPTTLAIFALGALGLASRRSKKQA